MTLQNRVSPFGDPEAHEPRGLFMGNRGGRIHTDARVLAARRFASKQWICCILAFKDRHRDVWGSGYTELFFLDEVTALAAGHRPCFECRRTEAQAFADAWERATGTRPRAARMDALLHTQRRDGAAKRLHRAALGDLPDGAMIAREGHGFAVRGASLLRWSPAGYDTAVARGEGPCDLLTPPAIVAAVANGYRPHWHPSALRVPAA